MKKIDKILARLLELDWRLDTQTIYGDSPYTEYNFISDGTKRRVDIEYPFMDVYVYDDEIRYGSYLYVEEVELFYNLMKIEEKRGKLSYEKSNSK